MRLRSDPTGEIDELVESLESAHSPWQKVKVLAEGWRTVRKLRPDERFLVAKHVGLEGAEVFLDKLSDAYRGLPTEDLLEIVRAADAEDFERWKGVVGRLRRKEERKELLRQGLVEVKGALLQEAVPSEVSSADVPALPEEPVEIVEARPESEPESETTAEREETVAKEAPSLEPVQSEAEPEPEREDVEARAEGPRLIETGSEPEEEVPLKPLLELLTTSDTILSRLRRFDTLVEEMRRFGPNGIERLLASLPPGWARRRALVRLIQAGIPEELEDALLLIETLEKPSDRLWCLSTLVDSRTLAPNEKRVLLTRIESPVLRRRLELRLDH